METAHKDALEASKSQTESASKQLLDDLQAKYDTLLEEKTTMEDTHLQTLRALEADSEQSTKSALAELQSKYDTLAQEKAAADLEHSRTIATLKEEADTTSKQLLDELQAKYDKLQVDLKTTSEALSNLQTRYEVVTQERGSDDEAQKAEIQNLQSQRDDLSTRLAELEKSHADSLAKQLAIEESHAKALETQHVEIEQKYAALLEIMQNDTERLEQERAAAIAGRQTALNELASLKEQSGSSANAEIASKYEALLAEKTAADKEHEDAVALLKDSLKADYEQALSKLQSECDKLQRRIAETDQAHSDAMELLKEEFKAGHSNDMQALRQQLEAVQKQHRDLNEQKTSMDQAHEEAIAELMAGMEASTSEALRELRKKYDDLSLELEEAHFNHSAALEAAKREAAQQRDIYWDSQLQEKLKADAAAESSNMLALGEKIRAIERERDEAIRAAEEAEDRIETMKGEVVRKHLARVEPLEKENLQLLDKIDRLEAMLAAGDRIARAAASLGEQRDMNTLAEEEEEEDNGTGAVSGTQRHATNGTGAAKDVVGTVS